jgi:hypothetical protein
MKRPFALGGIPSVNDVEASSSSAATVATAALRRLLSIAVTSVDLT